VSKKVRSGAIVGLVLLAVLGSVLVIAIMGKWKSSNCHSQCAKCGCSRHVKIRLGVRVRDDIRQNDLSEWLSGFRTGTCPHVWIPVSGWGSRSNIAWDGVSHWNSCLNHIKELDPTVGEAVTKQLLKRYYTILEMGNGQERNAKFKEFREELKSKLNEIDSKRMDEDAASLRR